MKLMKRSLIVGLCLGLFTLSVFAQKDKKIKEAEKQSLSATEVLNEIMDKPDKSIPRELLERAEAIAIFPGVLKAAFIFGGRGGEGVILRRTDYGWSAPAFFKVGGGSFGAQIGGEKTDYILLMMNDGALKGLLKDKFEFGGEASLAAGPVGRTTSATTNATLKAGILSYSRTQGAFIGASLKGGFIAPNKDLNEAVYNMKAKDVLNNNDSNLLTMPDALRKVMETLGRYSTRQNTVTTTTSNTAQRDRVANSTTATTTTDTTKTNIYTVVRNERRINPDEIADERVRAQFRQAQNIRKELLTLSSYTVFDWLEFEMVDNSTVILRGQATKPILREEAESAVRDVQGITNVQNEIEVLPASSADNDVRNAVYQNIYGSNSPLFRYATGGLPPIHVVVDGGQVKLKGLVDNNEDKETASIRAKEVSGNFEVVNELTITTLGN